MADYGVVPTGFNRKPLEEILSELDADIRAEAGQNINLKAQSADGQIFGILATKFDELWLVAEEVYYEFKPSSVSNAGLRSLIKINGLTAIGVKFTKIRVLILAETGTIVTAGSEISTDDGIKFIIEEDIEILDGVVNYGTAVCTVPGPVTVDIGTVTNIDTPIFGWAQCSNLADPLIGNFEETDPEIRSRREQSVAHQATSIVDAIRAGILPIQGVEEVAIYENDTATTDPDTGQSPYSIHVIVDSSSLVKQEVAQVVFDRKSVTYTHKEPGGIGQEYIVFDDDQVPHMIHISQPADVLIEINIETNVYANEVYGADGDQNIKDALVAFNLDIHTKFGVGDDVRYPRLFDPCNSVPGHSITKLEIRVLGTASYVETDLIIDYISKSSILDANIHVTSTII